MNTFVKIIRNGHMAPGKLADAELHFTGGELDGLRLIGFSIWARKDGTGQNVTFPARQFTTMVSAAASSCCAPLAIRLVRTVCGTSSCRRIARTNNSPRRLLRRESGSLRGRLQWQLQQNSLALRWFPCEASITLSSSWSYDASTRRPWSSAWTAEER